MEGIEGGPWDPETEGYPLDLVVGDVDESFQCMVCSGLVFHPVVTQCCHTIFCARCLRAWLDERGTCPQRCSGKVDPEPLENNKPLFRVLGHIHVKCAAQCGWEGEYSDLDEHMEKVCEHAKEQCEHCGHMRTKADASKHGPGHCVRDDYAPVAEVVDKDGEIVWLREQLAQARAEVEAKTHELKKVSNQLMRSRAMLNDALNQLEGKKAQGTPPASPAPSASPRASPNGGFPVRHHPGTWQRTRWKGHEVTQWTCCQSSDPDAPGCLLAEAGMQRGVPPAKRASYPARK